MADRSTQRAAALKAAMVSEHQRLLVHVQRQAAWRQLAPRDALVDGAQELAWPSAAGLVPAVAAVRQGLGDLWSQLLESSRGKEQETRSPAVADSAVAASTDSISGRGTSSLGSIHSSSTTSVLTSSSNSSNSSSSSSSIGSREAASHTTSATPPAAAVPATAGFPEHHHGVQYSRGHLAVKVSVPCWVPEAMEEEDEAALARCPARVHSQQPGKQGADSKEDGGPLHATGATWDTGAGAFSDGSAGDKLLWQMLAAVSAAVAAIVEAVEAFNQD